MGLQEKAALGGTSLSLYNGKICKKVPPEAPGAVSRTNKDGKLVHEKFYESIEGYLVYIEKIAHQEYGDAWMVHLHDGTDPYKLRIPYTGRQTDGLLRRLPEIDLKQPITIVVGQYETVPFLTVIQNGEKVPYFWTKENPGELPPMKLITVNNKKMWDHSIKMEYLEKYLEGKINPTLNKLHPNKTFNQDAVGSGKSKKVEEIKLPESDITTEKPKAGKDGYD